MKGFLKSRLSRTEFSIDILITGTNHINMMISLKDDKYHLGVCVRAEATIGVVRYKCKKVMELLNSTGLILIFD